MKHDDLRKQISEILVKWEMPTRQAAISEIIQVLAKAQEERDGKIFKGMEFFVDKDGFMHKSSIATLLWTIDHVEEVEFAKTMKEEETT